MTKDGSHKTTKLNHIKSSQHQRGNLQKSSWECDPLPWQVLSIVVLRKENSVCKFFTVMLSVFIEDFRSREKRRLQKIRKHGPWIFKKPAELHGFALARPPHCCQCRIRISVRYILRDLIRDVYVCWQQHSVLSFYMFFGPYPKKYRAA